MSRKKLTITLTEARGPKGTHGCHHRHKIGQSWDFDNDRGQLCPMAMHVAFVFADILRYGGKIPGQKEGTALFSCPDPDVLNIFKIETDDSLVIPHKDA